MDRGRKDTKGQGVPDPAPDPAQGSASPLTAARVLLEVCPPTVEDRERAYAVLRHSFACYNSFHAISVPDLQDAGEFNRKRNRVKGELFAAWLRDVSSKPLGLYKVCVTVTEKTFNAWLDR
ncbi:MAG: hypothetical protein ACE5ID_04900, partial [Acidobacteriota bacterium]